MIKLVLILVPFLLGCDARVVRLSLVKGDSFDEQFKPSTNSDKLQVFCDQNGYVMHCVQQTTLSKHVFPDEPSITNEGKAGVTIYKDGDCSYTPKPDGKEVAFLLMGECSEAKSLIIYDEAKGSSNDFFEVPIPGIKSKDGSPLNVWETCKVGKFPDKSECKWLTVPIISNIPEAATTWTDAPQGTDPFADDNDVYGNNNVLPQADLGGDSVSDDPRFEVGTPADSKVSPPKIAPVTYCDKGAYSCLSCSAGRVCVPTKDGQKYYEISRFACSAIYPYCNYTSGVCSSTPDPSCFDLPDTIESTNFICMRDGFYPDPKSCNKFYYCKNGKAYEHRCPYRPTPYYHPRLRHCVASKDFCAAETSAKFCALRENFGRKVPVLFTNNYFMYCGVNKNVLSVDRCIGSYFYDPVAQTCRFECSYEGLFVSMEDCSKYYKCSPQPQGGFIKTELSCPDGKAFYEPDYSCIDRSKVPNCKKAHPDSFSKK